LHLLEAVPLEVVEANPVTILVTATTISLTPLLGDITVVPLIAARITVAPLTAVLAVVMVAVLVVAVMAAVLAVVMAAVLAVAVMAAVLAVADFRQANFLLNNFAFPALNCLC
jgi:hypothetical protein